MFAGIDLGTYAAGGLEFRFGDRPVLPEDESEDSQALLQKGQAAAALAQVLPRRQIWREMGYDVGQIEQIEADLAAERAASEDLGSQLLRAFETGQ